MQVGTGEEDHMPRRNSHQYVEGGGESRYDRPSRSQKKRESTALQTLGEELAKLPLREIEKLGVSPDLVGAFRDLSRMTSREARRRQMQYVGRLMREEDDIPLLEDAVSLFKEGRRPSEALELRRESGADDDTGDLDDMDDTDRDGNTSRK